MFLKRNPDGVAKACNPKAKEARNRRSSEAHWPVFRAWLVSSKPIKNLLGVDTFLKITRDCPWPPHTCACTCASAHMGMCMCIFKKKMKWCLVFQDKVSLCDNTDCSRTHFVIQAGPKFTDIYLSPSPKWD